MIGSVRLRFFAFLPAAVPHRPSKILAKSFVKRILPITPTPAGIYAEIIRNSMKTRNLGGRGEGLSRRCSGPQLNQAQSEGQMAKNARRPAISTCAAAANAAHYFHGQTRRLRLHRQAAGRHRPHRGRVRQAAQSRRAKLLRALPLPSGKDRRRSPCTPRSSSSIASAAAPRATSSPSSRRSRTSPFPKRCG